MTFTAKSPMVTATAVVPRYSPIALLPMRESFLKSASDATPTTSEVMTSGMAISLSRLRNIFPKGAIQFAVNPLRPCCAATTP